MKNTYTFQVTSTVEVKLDPEKFTPEFMREFNESITQMDGLEDHARLLACLAADGRIDMFTKSYEGYGELAALGIETRAEVEEVDLLHMVHTA